MGDVANTLVHGGLELVQTFRRAELVVQADDFKLHTGWVAFVGFLGKVLQGFQLVGTNRGHQAGQGVNPSNLDGFTFLGKSVQRQQTGECQRQPSFFRCHSNLLIAISPSLMANRGLLG